MKKNTGLFLTTAVLIVLFTHPLIASENAAVPQSNSNFEASLKSHIIIEEQNLDRNERVDTLFENSKLEIAASLVSSTKNFFEVGVNIKKIITWLWPSDEQKEKNENATRLIKKLKIENELNQCLLKNRREEMAPEKHFPVACNDLVEQFLNLAGHEYIDKLVAFRTLPK